jgi:hypothetical protein
LLNEYEKEGFVRQLKRDANLWRLTLKYPGNPARGAFLRRIFLVLRFGNFLYSPKKGEWKFWYETNWPIATALSHGGRILIQLPMSNSTDESERDHSFWNWLITGSKKGDLSNFISTNTNGDDIENKIIFKRLAATHSIEYKNISEEINEEITKFIHETKTSGLSFRDTKIFSKEEYT